PLLARSFYALQDTKTPFFTSVLSLAVNVAVALLLVGHFQVVGLAIAISLGAIINAVVLFIILHFRLEGLPLRKIGALVARVSLASLAMGLFGYGALQVMSWIINTHTFVGLLLQATVATGVAVLTYLVIVQKFNLPELNLVTRMFKKFRLTK
ncbi:MAG: lipid II flippase MurJ, partial [Patescibacteria group bacterium]